MNYRITSFLHSLKIPSANEWVSAIERFCFVEKTLYSILFTGSLPYTKIQIHNGAT